jgi:tetratricopeptide (TPR) repeat protein
MNLEKLKDAARKHELKEDWNRAIEVYQRAIEAFESGADGAPDLTVYNRIGDLQLRVNDTAAAVASYERAADLYADQGFVNNAIALCGKILRVNPGRVQTYLRLAQLHARKNVVIDAQRNLLEYLERMHAQGRLEEAFGSIRQFAAQFAASPDIRQMLAELLRAGARSGEIRAQLERLADELDRAGDHAGAREARARIEEMEDDGPGGGGLVFLDTGVGPPARAAAVPGLQRLDPAGVVVEPLEIETGRADDSASRLDDQGASPMPGLETTAMDVDLAAADEGKDATFEGLLVADSLAGAADAPPAEGLDVEQVEVGPIELEPSPPADFEVTHPGDAGPLEPTAETGLVADVGMPGGAPPAPGYEPLPAPAPPSLDDLADRVLDDPEAPEAHRALGEALLAAGERDRGREELELALERYEARSDWAHAGDVLTELIRLDPVSIRLYQKRVELGFRMGDRARLLDAYLELADCLVRVGSLEKAGAVYRRVLEHEPGNDRARAALDAIEPPASGTAAGGVATAAGYAGPPPAGSPGRGAPEAAAASAEPAYVDLGAMLLDEAVPRGDTRIRVEDEEPTGDEEADFRQILRQFKTGIERGLAADDFQAHYDLGIAFREMGLLDEAIAEFQKALRAPEGRLRTAEALGGCFFEKGQFPVAAAILRRAVDTLEGGDDDKIGLLYWLGRSEEEQGRGDEAAAHYQRALAVDIGFRDLTERLGRLTGGAA